MSQKLLSFGNFTVTPQCFILAIFRFYLIYLTDKFDLYVHL